MGIELIYKWNEEYYMFDLYELIEGKELLLASFEDREDLLIYVEKHFAIANLIVRGGMQNG